MNNKRCYTWEIVLPNEAENYLDMHTNLILNFDAIWCTQDKDIYDDDVFDENMNLLHKAGDLKYTHTHYLIKLKTAKTLSAVAKIVKCKDTDVNYIKKTFDSALVYLVHFNCDDKYQYDPSDVQSNCDKLLSRFHKLIDNKKEMDDRVIPLFDFIDESEYLTFKQLVQYVYSTRQWNTFRANIGIYTRYLDEHNQMYDSQAYSLLNRVSIKKSTKKK